MGFNLNTKTMEITLFKIEEVIERLQNLYRGIFNRDVKWEIEYLEEFSNWTFEEILLMYQDI